MRAFAAGLLAASALPLCGCRAPQPRPLIDLARQAPVADLESSYQLILFGTPSAEGMQENGFRREGPQDEGDVWAAAAPSARLLLRWAQPEPRLAVLDLEPLAGSAGQAFEVALNGTALARQVMGAGRRRYGVVLPEEAQKPGVNRLRLVFGEAPANEPAVGRPSAARLYSLAVGSPSDPTMQALIASERARPVLSLDGTDEARTLTLAGPSALYASLALPERAELRLAATVHTAAGTDRPLRLRVTLQEEGGPRRELWTSTLQADEDTGDVQIALPGAAGAPVRLGLHVEDPEGGGAAWAVWRSPRVWGYDAPDQPLASEPPDAPPESAHVARLREAVAGSNVLLVVLDAAAARHFGAYGYGRRTTPEIDRIAREGIVFERAYTPAVFTYAAVAALWTSQVPDQGHSEWIRNGDGMLPVDRPTLAEILTANGVHTAAFVANPSASTAFGLDRGFAEFHPLYQPPWSNDGVPGAETFRQALHPWLERRGSQRFFAYAHFREPHSPYQPPAPFDRLFAAGPVPADAGGPGWLREVTMGTRAPSAEELDRLVRLYDANLAYADREVGRLRAALERLGLWERTLVIVTADHGEAMYEHGWVGHNTQVYDESARIPLIMKLPARAATAGVRVGALTGLLDVAPTIAEAFGLDREAAPSFRGRSLLPLCLGSGRAASVVSRNSGWTYGLVHGRHKFVNDLSSASQEMYDLDADPGERTDLAYRQPVRAALYRQALHRWLLDLRGEGPARTRQVQLDARQRESLKALGYLQ